MRTNKDKPVVGLTLDREPGGEDQYSRMPWYAIRENYCTSVSRAGGIPLPLSYELALVEDIAALLDGLITTGGAFDIPPSMYGAANVHEKVSLKETRTAFEAEMIRIMLRDKKPVLGICGGQQLLNVLLGGTLIQHVPDAFPDGLAHEQPNPRTEPGHAVNVSSGTLLHKIVGKSEIMVNSAHHQAVEKLGPGVIVDAMAPDGVIEGIEYPSHPFCIGVQWHPEYHITPADTAIFDAFTAACRR